MLKLKSPWGKKILPKYSLHLGISFKLSWTSRTCGPFWTLIKKISISVCSNYCTASVCSQIIPTPLVTDNPGRWFICLLQFFIADFSNSLKKKKKSTFLIMWNVLKFAICSTLSIYRFWLPITSGTGSPTAQCFWLPFFWIWHSALQVWNKTSSTPYNCF